MDIIGNLIVKSKYEGIRLALSLRDSLSVRIYNNTLYHNYEAEWSHELRIESNSANIAILEVKNNIFHAASTTRCLGDDDGDISAHSNNIYYRPDGGTLVTANGVSYTGGDVNSWEPTALIGDPHLKDPSDLPSGFSGMYGVDLEPATDGLNITAGSPARDSGVSLGRAYGSSINSVTRPSGVGWDVGAYEFAPTLALHGTPADRAIHLGRTVNTTLPATSTWQIDYQSQYGTLYTPITGIISPTRVYTLTGLKNYAWYTATLSATSGGVSFLSDTVRVMPTDIFEYLPFVLKDD